MMTRKAECSPLNAVGRTQHECGQPLPAKSQDASGYGRFCEETEIVEIPLYYHYHYLINNQRQDLRSVFRKK